VRFVPDADEGFSLRGDRRQLLYKGRKRSHRFTILGDSSFEYDCILNREPESNVIGLRIEGAEGFDFFRQPDFIRDPFIAGSYAVYKKDTFVGEGTGKLCHIHRPKIIDARGRWVWGDLSIAGERLCITIPEKWLSEAKYPVIVDPTIGTTTVGSLHEWDNHESDPNEPWIDLEFEICIPVNKFLTPASFNGTCTGYAYTEDNYREEGGRPVIYSDNNDIPLNRKTKEEGYIDFSISGTKPPGWRSGSFKTNGAIGANSYIWFGICTEYMWSPRFDWGAKCHDGEWYDEDIPIPDIYPLWRNGEYYENFKLSMYFTYTASQNYTRTLTQGVKLTDSRKLTANYKRTAVMNGQNTTALGHGSAYYRKHTANVINTDLLSRVKGYCYTIAESLKAVDLTGYCRDMLRKIAVTVRSYTDGGRNVENRRDIASTAGSGDRTAWGRGFFRNIATLLHSGDMVTSAVGWFRRLPDLINTADRAGSVNEYVRGLYTEAGNLAETSHSGDYFRKQEDTVHVEALSLRHLVIFIKLVTVGFVRDFIIRRILRSNEELVLKSRICREIEIESRIH
jgi:hypothetical protein